MEKLKSNGLGLRKFRSVRDKNAGGSHRRSKSSDGKSRPLTLDIISIFRPESAKQAQREREEEEKEAAKIEDVMKRLVELNYNGLSEELVRYALNSKFASGDVEKAVELLRLQQRAFAGIIEPYNPQVQMLGAENRSNVTCYLDALLFAMFANMTAFECMLKNDSTDEAKRKLAALTRLWVNMLRSGKLIHTDMTQLIQESLSACGWKDAERLEQQDTSEAFAFITETLQLPLLALQVDLFHQGKGDEDDHKVVHERLLNLAVPPDPEGKGIKLEDCLEEYFNNKVDVLRDSLEEKKGYDRPTPGSNTTIRVVTEGEELQSAEHVESPTMPRRWTTQEVLVQTPLDTPTSSFANAFESPSISRNRSTSIIQRIVVDDQTQASDAATEGFLQRAKRTGSTVVKAVTIPAWQFFRLIRNNEPSSDAEVARHFNKRPVLSICLKRYTMTEQGVPIRQNTLIDIPDMMRLPHFMVADDVKLGQESTGLSQEYKLVLQSVICHRGDSLHSGHYIAFARVAPKLLTDNRRHDHDPPPDYEEAQWVRFDDLEVEGRVTYVDDIKESLREEMPYLLFYQIAPMVDMTATSTEGSVTDPPSYIESATSQAGGLSPGDAMTEGISRSTSGYFDSSTTLVHNGPSIRFSSEIERPSLSFDDDPYSVQSKPDGSRRGSTAISEPAVLNSGINDVPSPAVTPPDESTAARLSRAAAKFASKSRPTSQAGEGRISLTISRLGFSRPSKDPLNNCSSEAADETAIVEEGAAAGDSNKEKDHHLLHSHHKKERTKSKSREKEEKKDKGKQAKDVKTNVPDRECVVM
ncbi:ubiquitin carboxyl-terminal hydrolase-domain-containing protein [Immersiella caudata]|uniref:ubiquitinyl hydrolase 1 n=1 Tax=Immersiella caudata TaxID=314043 RepID=A0AA40C5W7_9PEZI|nr:ubiquitin carboxyl-terminal hydrolase-domain-containing protein [Immersiella caudata]